MTVTSMMVHVAQPVPTPPRVTVKFSGRMFDVLAAHLRADPAREQFAFVLAAPVVTADGLLLLVQNLFLPEPGDLVAQSAAGVEPHPDFQALVYLMAQQSGLVILDVHTHVTDKPPSFSSIDRNVADRNARYIVQRFPQPTTLGMVVFNRDITAHDALLFDRARGVFDPMGELQIVGPGLDIRPTSVPAVASDPDERYARQRLVPGWNQAALERLRVGIAGVGGHGAQLLQTLVAIGAGSAGWVAAVDPDTVEPSNLPRIPYAAPDEVGTFKVEVAANFVRRKNPAAAFYPYACSVADPAALARLRGADVLFGCGDNDGVRLTLNNVAVRCGIPLVDLGADIHIAGDTVEAGGQVRVVVPGTTACLACSGALDTGQAALDLLSADDRAVYRRRGYIIGGEQEATPSVAVLNALVVQHAVTALLAFLRSGPFTQHDYLQLDWLTGRTLTARAPRRDDCPACGAGGFLMAGTPPERDPHAGEPAWLDFPCTAASGRSPANKRSADRCRGGTASGT